MIELRELVTHYPTPELGRGISIPTKQLQYRFLFEVPWMDVNPITHEQIHTVRKEWSTWKDVELVTKGDV